MNYDFLALLIVLLLPFWMVLHVFWFEPAARKFVVDDTEPTKLQRFATVCHCFSVPVMILLAIGTVILVVIWTIKLDV